MVGCSAGRSHKFQIICRHHDMIAKDIFVEVRCGSISIIDYYEAGVAAILRWHFTNWIVTTRLTSLLGHLIVMIFIFTFMSDAWLVIVCGLLWHAEQVELLLTWPLARSFLITLLELFWLLNARHHIVMSGRFREFSLNLTSELTKLIFNWLVNILLFVDNLVKWGQISGLLMSLSPEEARVSLKLRSQLRGDLMTAEHRLLCDWPGVERRRVDYWDTAPTIWHLRRRDILRHILLSIKHFLDWILWKVVIELADLVLRGTYRWLLRWKASDYAATSVRPIWLKLVLLCAPIGEPWCLFRPCWLNYSLYFSNTISTAHTRFSSLCLLLCLRQKIWILRRGL